MCDNPDNSPVRTGIKCQPVIVGGLTLGYHLTLTNQIKNNKMESILKAVKQARSAKTDRETYLEVNNSHRL